MRISINGEDRETQHRTLAALWAAEAGRLAPDGAEPASRRGFAIARNGEVVRSQAWDGTVIDEGDRVEIIRAMAGG